MCAKNTSGDNQSNSTNSDQPAPGSYSDLKPLADEVQSHVPGTTRARADLVAEVEAATGMPGPIAFALVEEKAAEDPEGTAKMEAEALIAVDGAQAEQTAEPSFFGC